MNYLDYWYILFIKVRRRTGLGKYEDRFASDMTNIPFVILLIYVAAIISLRFPVLKSEYLFIPMIIIPFAIFNIILYYRFSRKDNWELIEKKIDLMSPKKRDRIFFLMLFFYFMIIFFLTIIVIGFCAPLYNYTI